MKVVMKDEAPKAKKLMLAIIRLVQYSLIQPVFMVVVSSAQHYFMQIQSCFRRRPSVAPVKL